MKASIVAVLALFVVGSQGAISPEVRAHVDLINQYRSKHGLGPVCINENLQKAAEYHSNEQSRRRDMGHETRYGSFGNRAQAYGYGGAASENVAMNVIAPNAEQQEKCRDPVGNYFPRIRDTVEAAKYAACQLYNSPGHRTNMLKPDVNQIGYSFAINGQQAFHTEMYGRSDQPCASDYGPPGNRSPQQQKPPKEQPRTPYQEPKVPSKQRPSQPPKEAYTPPPPAYTPSVPSKEKKKVCIRKRKY